MTVSVQDGKLYCEFTRPKDMSVVNMMNPSERLGFDLKNDYYVMIAWGYLHRGILYFSTNIKGVIVSLGIFA